jgi:lipopolysaccharide transport system permease protein
MVDKLEAVSDLPPSSWNSPAEPPAPVVTVIQSTQGQVALKLAELWRFRELLFFLVWRDVKVRYKQTLLGASWAILQPLATMIIFTVIFGRLAKLPSDGVPYPVFALAALVPWTFFANALGQATNSLVGSANLITKVYFPRLIIPTASILAGLVDFAISFAFLVCAYIYYGIVPSARVLTLPLFLLLALVFSFGFGFWLSALNVKYRDVRHVVPFITQIGLYATPVAYPSSLLGPKWQLLYAINPMVGVVEGVRWALFGTNTLTLPMIAMSSTTALIMFFIGLVYFRSTEREFADLV